MRVLFVTNIWPEDGRPWSGAFIKGQADSLQAAGVDVDVLSIPGYEGVGAYAQGCARAFALNGNHSYDVVHAHYGLSGIVGRFQVRAPLVVSYLGSDLLGKWVPPGRLTTRSRVEAGIFRQVARVAAATITKSAQMERRLPASVRGRNHVIPNGVDLDRFRPLPKEEARLRLGWDPSERAILYVGDPGKPWKGHALADEVATRVGEALPKVRFRVAWQVDPDLIPTWMNAADVLLLSSRSEGSPNVVKEAMASELPVVATPVGDVPERLAGLPGCYVCPPRVDQLAEAVTRALDHGRVPQARDAVAMLADDKVARRILAVYEAVSR